jgi:hypothetical protein
VPFASPEGRPTAHEKELLAKIVNPKQKAALLAAIEQGEEIPTFAWHPLPAGLDLDEVVADAGFREAAGAMHEAAEEAGVSPGEMIGQIDSGWLVTDFIESIKDSKRDERGLLESPVSGYEALWDSDASTMLFQWIYFNPMGPTINELNLYEDSLKNRWVLGVSHLHPLDRDVTALAVFADETVRSADRILAVLTELFRRDDVGEAGPIITSLPTSVIVGDESPLQEEHVRTLFEMVAGALKIDDLDETCRMLEEHKGDPWERTAQELHQAVSKIVEKRLGTRSGESGADPLIHFGRWWSLVTDPEHADSELENLPAAFEGAIRMQRGEKP